MQPQKIFYLIVLIAISLLNNVTAQSEILSAGGDASGSDGSIAYSIGQVAFTNYASEAGIVSLGVQQPFLMLMVGNGEPDISIVASISPNPTSTSVNLKLDDQFLAIDPDPFFYSLYNLNGQQLFQNKIVSPVTSIPMEDVPNAVYILRVTRNNTEIKTFKIFKSQ
jgi:hypothetical protein